MADLHVALIHPEIPWNTGNTARTCLAMGAALHLVHPLGFSLGQREVRRAGLDYWENVELVEHSCLADFERALPHLGEPWFLSAEGSRTLWQADLTPPGVFVLGRESDGLPARIREAHRDRLISVPQRADSVRSLNQSTTAAIACAEYRRRFPDVQSP